ncbi:bifunctional 4-hydroxy-2-oxoglutarate aldolase/2-dehydro-3-deoxy-phosphogluconate aldolase [Prochlorococcus marinus]|uniref:bifunctional 4-hydroxy-2-oxoglutarate aldolase/2-dehydro-3-deoxy-phosphogluconate aldolase n=1 Tax=Prochlorococcus marinus TaxID=1219 RepID=UPI0022B56E51|nr:bifunctional 4-hydroxy-2-oxoglutarate aldolase/2-dehydro-3-deoxy-phosphogluconate aldolase [Prochlorococcus marinus]
MNIWLKKQADLVSSLSTQPLIIVVRIPINELDNCDLKPVIKLITGLRDANIKHIEIAWSHHKNWSFFIEELNKAFQGFSFGAASVSHINALDEIKQLGFSYAMSPCWNLELQEKAKVLDQILIPGVLTPSEIYQAINFGHKIIKLFPATLVGSSYLNQIKASFSTFPFVIAAGGLRLNDLNAWLKNGCNAIALGRSFSQKENSLLLLKKWIIENNL